MKLFGVLIATLALFAGGANAATREFTYLGTQKLKHSVDKGGPVSTENGDIKIEVTGHVGALEPGVGLTLEGAYGFTVKRPLTITRVRVEDVSGETAKLMVDDEKPELSAEGYWKGRGDSVLVDAQRPEWIHVLGDTWRIFRFTITTAQKGDIVLLQPSWSSAEMKTGFLLMAAQARPKKPNAQLDRFMNSASAALGGRKEFMIMGVFRQPNREMADKLGKALVQAKNKNQPLAVASEDGRWLTSLLETALRKAKKGQYAGVTLVAVAPGLDAAKLQAFAQPSGLTLKVGPLIE